MHTDWRVPVLASYAYLRSAPKDAVKWIYDAAENKEIELLVDSGAFTALNAGKEIRLDEYLSFLAEYQSIFCGYMQLDKLGDPVTSEKNLGIMRDKGFSPIPIHVRGDDRARMDELFTVSDWVALGGFRRPQRGPAPKSYVKVKMEWAAGRRVHWLGYVDVKMVSAFRPYSCDCSTWLSGILYGTVSMYKGNGTWARVNRRDKSKLPLEPWQASLLSQCGFTVADFYDDRNWKEDTRNGIKGVRCLPLMVSAMSWVRFSYEVFRRFGTRLFIATAVSDVQTKALGKAVRVLHGH